jgi:hypothetical protein
MSVTFSHKILSISFVSDQQKSEQMLILNTDTETLANVQYYYRLLCHCAYLEDGMKYLLQMLSVCSEINPSFDSRFSRLDVFLEAAEFVACCNLRSIVNIALLLKVMV